MESNIEIELNNNYNYNNDYNSNYGDNWEYNEIDNEYEFDAAMCFDFTKQESRAEARAAEQWFQFASTYPPSPFVRRLILREDLLQEESANAAVKSNEPVTMALLDDEADIGMGECSSAVDQVECSSVMETSELADCIAMNGGISEMLQSGNLQNQLTGSCFYNPVIKEISKAKPKSSVKSRYPRTSTLMKPTASQLAKQNQPRKVADTKNSMHPFGVEVQPAKRQKLEGGLMHKVPDLKPQSNFVHKAPKKDGTTTGLHANIKLTIPREPELETAHRAQKTRPKITTEEPERTTFRRFKALPLNKKILEAPGPFLPKRTIPRLPEFQEFHLKTSERAMQHASSVPPFSGSFGNTNKVLDKSGTHAFAECTSGGPKRSNLADTSKQGGSDFVHSFKARPLNKKIFISKGDIGVFRNIKKEVTVPLEFNFQTDRRAQNHPPVELFDKLSLAEVQPNTIPKGKPPRPSNIPSKGPKENRVSYFQPEHETKGDFKEKQRRVWEKHPQSAKDEIIKLGPTYGFRSRTTSMR